MQGQGQGARRALTRDLGLLAGIAGVAGVARVEYLLGAGQVLVCLLWHPWKAGRGQGLPVTSGALSLVGGEVGGHYVFPFNRLKNQGS